MSDVRNFFPPGHFHSPVVDPSTVKDYVEWSRAQPIAGIDLPLEAMQAFYERHLPMFKATRLAKTRETGRRYYESEAPFPVGDVLSLRAMLLDHKPRRIIEIGSGFSSAAMLDTAEEFGLSFRLTCIEPYPERLRSLLRPSDRVEIIEQELQTVPLERFHALESGDIVFIDSTHVLKTGSDVHYELFHILPALRAGVIVHFHDCRYPFEYPNEWIFERNYSWNETYALRAFLMYNARFRVIFWHSFIRHVRHAWFAEHFPEMLPKNPGGSIWLRVGQ